MFRTSFFLPLLACISCCSHMFLFIFPLEGGGGKPKKKSEGDRWARNLADGSSCEAIREADVVGGRCRSGLM